MAVIRARADSQGGGVPPAVQDLDLFLPSQLIGHVNVDQRLLRYEFDLRIPQAHATLDEVRSLLLLRSHMYKSKNRLMRGQRQNTRSNVLLSRVEERIKAACDKYNHVYRALTALSDPLLEFKWRQIFQTLEVDDVKGLTSIDHDGSEGRKKLTWIWTIQGAGVDTSEKRTNAGERPQNHVKYLILTIFLALRIEWCKARARAHRWQEECLLLEEEMRRVLATFTWQSSEWKKRAEDQVNKLPSSLETDIRLVAADIAEKSPIRQGKIAYAHYQADIRDQMKGNCQKKWEGLSTRLRTMEGHDATKMVECHQGICMETTTTPQ